MRYIAVASYLQSAVLDSFEYELVYAVTLDRWDEEGTRDGEFGQTMSNDNDGHWHVAAPRRASAAVVRAKLRRALLAEAADQGWLPIDVHVI